jgi:hypothetical protein
MFSGLEIRSYGGSVRSGIYLGDPKNFLDLVNFWNIRATGTTLGFVTVPDFGRTDQYGRSLVATLDDATSTSPTTFEHMHFHYQDKDDAVIGGAIGAFKTTKPIIRSQCSAVSWNGLNFQPSTSGFDWDQVVGIVDNERGRYTVTISLPEKRFLLNFGRADSQLLAVSISSPGDYEYPGYTLGPPYRRELNELYSRAITFDPWAIRSEHDGVAALINVSDKSLRLNPLPQRAVAQGLMKLGEITIEPSQAGRLADKLQEQLEPIQEEWIHAE